MITLSACGNEGSTNAVSNDSNPQSSDAVETQSTTSLQEEIVVVGQEIAASLDPVQPLTSSYLRNIGAAEALFRVNAEGIIEPSLAESGTAIDPTTWEIKLREEAAFWSGSRIDADAVIASLERSRELDLQAKPFLDELTFKKVDDYTVHVTTTRDYLQVPLNLSYYQTIIYNANLTQDSIAAIDFSGMYKIVEFIPKQKMILEVNENYWGTKPSIERVVYEEITDEQTRVLSVLSGRSHIALNIPATSLAQFEESSVAYLSTTPAANTQTIYLNLNKPQLQDLKVRQALSWALNREELVLLATEGLSFPVSTWLSSNPAYAQARNSVYTNYDVNKASELLDEAGWLLDSDGIRYKDELPLSINLMTWGGDKALGEAIQHQWTKLGVKATIQHGDYSLIQTAREADDWDASIEAWSTFGDEFTLLTGQFSSQGSANYGGYNDEETNQLLSQLSAANNQEERHALSLKINERVSAQAPIISLFPRPQITAVSQALQGFEDHFRQFENTINASLHIESK